MRCLRPTVKQDDRKSTHARPVIGKADATGPQRFVRSHLSVHGNPSRKCDSKRRAKSGGRLFCDQMVHKLACATTLLSWNIYFAKRSSRVWTTACDALRSEFVLLTTRMPSSTHMSKRAAVAGSIPSASRPSDFA